MLQNVRIKCIFATRTFSKGKCSASHFTLENVQHQQNVTNAFWLCKNAFDAKMHFGVHFPKENVQLCKNAFDAKMHLMRTFCFALPKCILASNAFLHQQNVTNAFDALQKYIFASHFVTQNVTNAFWLCKNAFLHHIFQRKMFSCAKMHFGNATRTFYEVKCSAPHFPKENVQHHIFQRKMFSTSNVNVCDVFCSLR